MIEKFIKTFLDFFNDDVKDEIDSKDDIATIKDASVTSKLFDKLLTLLHDSANFFEIEKVITNGLDINARDQIGQTPLMAAVIWHDDPTVIEKLIKAGADVNMRNKYGETSLMYAIKSGNISVTKTLIRMGADINICSEEGCCPIPGVMLDDADLLCGQLKEFEDREEGGTPLMYAVMENKIPMVKLLIKAGADINAKNENGVTPLIVAVARSDNYDCDIIETLLKAGAIDIRDKYGETAFDYAKKNSYIKKSSIFWKLKKLKYQK